MAVYKKPGRKPYYFNYYDKNGRRRFKSSGTTDKRVAEEIAAKFRTDVALRKYNVIDVELEASKEQLATPIIVHLDAYEESLAQRNVTAKHVESSRKIIDRLIVSQSIEKLSEFTDEAVSTFVASLASEGRSKRTIEANLQAIKAFGKWLLKSKRVTTDRLASVEKPKANGEKIVDRRALTHEEWTALDGYCRLASVPHHGMSGLERALLYAAAIQTGLRSSELRSINRGHLMLRTESPCILVSAKNTKNRKQARQYIQPELAIELQNLVGKKLAGTPVFSMPSKYDVADMLRADMEGARQAWLQTIGDSQARIEADQSDFLKSRNSAGETLDFHSLRHTTATWLIEAGADPKTVQSVMRHSTIKLTLDIYGHLFAGSEANAVATIRDRFIDQKRATGTESMGTIRAQFRCKPLHFDASRCLPDSVSQEVVNIDSNKQNTGETNEIVGEVINTPARIRTLDLRIRNQGLSNEIVGQIEPRAPYGHNDPRLEAIVKVWPTLTESQRNRAYKIALDAASKRGAE